MGFAVKILADSVTLNGKRLTTVEGTYPRLVHAEVMTHRQFSRNAASSRAIPSKELIRQVKENPFIPDVFGSNQKGMQAGEALVGLAHEKAVSAWLKGRDYAVATAEELAELDVHKQIANRGLETYQWYTAIISATEWENFFGLRCHPDAQPQINTLATLIRAALADSIPNPLMPGKWHLPLTPDLAELIEAGFGIDQIKKISAGRCARVSYLTHHGERDPSADIILCERLISSGHMSPMEHVARAATPLDQFGTAGAYGNFQGFVQFRKELPNEDNFQKATTLR